MATTQTTTLRTNILAPKPAPSSPAPPQQRIRPYRDFLTPDLHRRFGWSALTIIGACFLTSILLSNTSSLWLWITLALIRTLLLFIPCLAVLIVRVNNLHCGTATTSSPAQAVLGMLGGLKGLYTLGWYVFSACFFGEVYIWSRDARAGLGWVDVGSEYERARLNENPVFLRALFVCMAIAQTALHLARGEDQLPISTRDADPTAQQQQQQTFLGIPESAKQLQLCGPTIAGRILRLAIPGFAFTVPVYFLLLRSLLWPYFYTVGRTFFGGLPPQTRPTGLTNLATLTWQCITASCMTIALWEFSNALFTIFVSRPPLTKADQPLTSAERAADPNGSLISGLKSKKELPKTFAFWELSLICAYFPARRKTIYTEVDRPGGSGSAWAQISGLCLNEIAAIQARIREAAQQQATPANILPAAPEQPQWQGSLGLPKIADRSVQTGDVWVKQRPEFVHSVGNLAKEFGQSPNAPNPVVPRAKRAIGWSADRVLSKEEQQRWSTEGLRKEAGGAFTSCLKTPLGEPLRQTFARRVNAVIFGTPYSRKMNIIHASRALSTLCVHSLKEDDYGQVAKSVSTIMRAYTNTITSINNFVATLTPHWTDVYFEDKDRDVNEVREVVTCLKEGLEGVVLAFGEYASSVGVNGKELREARELVGRRVGDGGGIVK